MDLTRLWCQKVMLCVVTNNSDRLCIDLQCINNTNIAAHGGEGYIFLNSIQCFVSAFIRKNPATMRRYNSYQCLPKLEECGGGNCVNEIKDLC